MVAEGISSNRPMETFVYVKYLSVESGSVSYLPLSVLKLDFLGQKRMPKVMKSPRLHTQFKLTV
jgi:hypothetical protein